MIFCWGRGVVEGGGHWGDGLTELTGCGSRGTLFTILRVCVLQADPLLNPILEAGVNSERRARSGCCVGVVLLGVAFAGAQVSRSGVAPGDPGPMANVAAPSPHVPVRIPTDVVAKSILSNSSPVYPAAARAARVSERLCCTR